MQPEAVYVNFAMNVFYGTCFGYFYSHFKIVKDRYGQRSFLCVFTVWS